jgi:hypothetical protein
MQAPGAGDWRLRPHEQELSSFLQRSHSSWHLKRGPVVRGLTSRRAGRHAYLAESFYTDRMFTGQHQFGFEACQDAEAVAFPSHGTSQAFITDHIVTGHRFFRGVSGVRLGVTGTTSGRARRVLT